MCKNNKVYAFRKNTNFKMSALFLLLFPGTITIIHLHLQLIVNNEN